MRASFVLEVALPRGARTRLRQVLRRVADELELHGRGVGVLFTSDARIRAFNRRWRKKDRATDVLSFEGDGHRYLGDLVISVETARVQALAEGHSLEDEIEILLLHGILHLLGHDHERDAGQMRRLEARLAKRVLGRPALIERTG